MSNLRRPQRHDDLLNFQLKRILTLGGAPAIRLCEGRFGVARLEWRVVAAIVESGPLSPSQLGDRTGIDLARVSRAVASLSEKRLVMRRKDPRDGRRVTVSATVSGEMLYRQLFPQLARINERLMSVLNDREAEVLQTCLRKLTEHARRIYEEGGGVEERADRRRGGSRRVWGGRLHERA